MDDAIEFLHCVHSCTKHVTNCFVYPHALSTELFTHQLVCNFITRQCTPKNNKQPVHCTICRQTADIPFVIFSSATSETISKHCVSHLALMVPTQT